MRYVSSYERIANERATEKARAAMETAMKSVTESVTEKVTERERERTAKEMLSDNLPIENIIKYTKLPKDKIEIMQQELVSTSR